jgi:hypothetical protein
MSSRVTVDDCGASAQKRACRLPAAVRKYRRISPKLRRRPRNRKVLFGARRRPRADFDAFPPNPPYWAATSGRWAQAAVTPPGQTTLTGVQSQFLPLLACPCPTASPLCRRIPLLARTAVPARPPVSYRLLVGTRVSCDKGIFFGFFSRQCDAAVRDLLRLL